MEKENLDWMEGSMRISLPLPISPIQEREPRGALLQPLHSSKANVRAPGGPLAVPGFTSGRINVNDFRQSCGVLLLALKAELEDPSMEVDDIDVSVDDLRVMTDSMLVEKALAEVLQVGCELQGQGSSAVPESRVEENGAQDEHGRPPSGERAADIREIRDGVEQVDLPLSLTKRKGKKRGRPFDRHIRGSLLMDDTDERRKEALARLKRERELARESVSLHSLRLWE